MLLSIVVPTVNRLNLLKGTLKQLAAQIPPGRPDIELICIDNASTDGTKEWFLENGSLYPEVKFVSVAERATIDDSFARCVALASGMYINIFGDDDVPLPGFIPFILKQIKESDASVFYVNRLIGDEALQSVNMVAHPTRPYDVVLFKTNEFVTTFTHWPSFISSLVFSAEVWNRGSSFDNPAFDGYRFLARLIAGNATGNWLFIAYPLLIQRRGHQEWKESWPQYWLLNFPALLAVLENNGLCNGAAKNWRDNEVSSKGLLADVLLAKSLPLKYQNEFWTNIARHQNWENRLIILFVDKLVPVAVAKYIWRRYSRYGSK